MGISQPQDPRAAVCRQQLQQLGDAEEMKVAGKNHILTHHKSLVRFHSALFIMINPTCQKIAGMVSPNDRKTIDMTALRN